MTMRTDAPSPGASSPGPLNRSLPVPGVVSLGGLVIAAVVVVDPAGLAPFGPARWLATSTLALGAGGLAMWNAQAAVDRTTLRLWLALLAFITLGAMLGGDLPTALVGHPDRHLGLITWVLFLIMFCAGQQLTDRVGQQTIARSAVVSTMALGLWSLWELTVGRPIDAGTATSRLTGPFGSAAISGAALCLLLPISIGRAVDEEPSNRWRIAAAAATILGAIALVGTGSRAAWLGMTAAGLVALVRLRPARRTIVVAGIVAIGAVAMIAPRLGEVVDRADGPASRLDEWRVATRVVTAHALIGVGPEGYRFAVSEGIDAHYERAHGRDRVLPDRAHSGPIDVALIGGIPAAIAYVALLVTIGRRAVRLIGAGSALDAAVAVSVVAYAAQQLLLFPLAELDPIWWLLAGVAMTAAHADDFVATPLAGRRIVAAAAMALAPIALVAGVLEVAADRLALRALDASASDEPDRAVDEAERAVELRPDNVRYRLVAAELQASLVTLQGIDAAIGHAERALDWSPLDPVASDAHASFLLERAGITGDQSDIDAALLEWRELVDRDRVRARWQLQLGRAEALDGNVELARQAWIAARQLAPDDPTASALLEGLGSS